MTKHLFFSLCCITSATSLAMDNQPKKPTIHPSDQGMVVGYHDREEGCFKFEWRPNHALTVPNKERIAAEREAVKKIKKSLEAKDKK
jgi:hypothetical protein